MEIRELNVNDAESFRELIIDLYSHINNLEWFSPMPYDLENVKGMLQNPRFYIVGLFVDNKLKAVSSLDFKCGKLIGKVDFPTHFDLTNIVEIGFTITKYSFQGNKSMQLLLDFLTLKIKLLKIKYVFGKVHVDNVASRKSLLNKGFTIFSEFSKNVNREDFENLANTEFFSPLAKPKAIETLNKFSSDIIVKYNIIVKEI